MAAGETDTGQRPSPFPRGGPEDSDVAMPAAAFDPNAGAGLGDEPHRFDISTYREGLYGGPGAELIGDSEFGSRWEEPRQSAPDTVRGAHELSNTGPQPWQTGQWTAQPQPWQTGPNIPVARDNISSELPPVHTSAADVESANSLVRPYTRTGGRTRSDYNLAIEALVSTSAQGLRSLGSVSPEQQSICGLCVDTRSVAEVAAHMRLPLGVAKVLIGDMAGMGLVMVHQSSAVVGDRPSMEFLERVLSGLRRL